MLYSLDSTQNEEKDLVELLMKELAVTKKTAALAYEKSSEILRKKESLDEKIADVSYSFDFDRIQFVEKNILRLCLYEILYDKTDPKIAISEGIRLAKKFASPASLRFVHALLDAMIKKMSGMDIDNKEIQDVSLALKQEEDKET